MTKAELRTKRREETYESLCHNISLYGMCNVERCCSFGKTEIFARYMREHPYQFLYLYDEINNKNRIIQKYGLHNVTLLSYSKFFRMSSSDVIELLIENDIRCIIFDESHTVGAKTIREKWPNIIAGCHANGIDVIGGTATELRSDGVNVTEEFFEGHRTIPYDIVDCIADGILVPPWYVEADFNTYEDDDLSILTSDEKRILVEANNPDEVLDYAMNLVGTDRSYVKLIIFYPNIKTIVERGIVYWKECLSRLFPDHERNIIPVTSSVEHRDNTTAVPMYVKRPNAVDVFLCVDMMTQGVHFEDLSGIVMCRNTQSPLVYTQQVGRCMSLDNTNDMFVVDLMRNFSSDFLVRNPLADVWGGIIGREDGCKTNEGWSQPERRLAHATPSQRAKREVTDKLNYAKQKAQALGLEVVRKMYQRFPEEDVTKLSSRVHMAPIAIIYWLYEQGLLREEDMVHNYEIFEEETLMWKLYDKYKATHKAG